MDRSKNGQGQTRTHKDLDIWRKGIELVERIYKISSIFPKEEIYGITSQMRRAAVSYPTNIAEGAARFSRKEFIQFVYISLGTLSELETLVIISLRLGYLSDKDALNEIELLRRMTLNFIKYLKSIKK
jgi:four helix bundle protein